REIVMTIWKTDAEAEDVRAVEPAQRYLLDRGVTKMASLAVAMPGALRISSEARAEAARVSAASRDRLIAVALVLPMGGFMGAAIRAAVTAVLMLVRSKAPQRTFKSVAE